MKRNCKSQSRLNASKYHPTPLNFRTAIASIFLFLAVSLFSTGAISADKAELNIEDTRTIIEKWVETQRTISKEKHDLALAKEMLNERIELVRREIQSLREKITDAEKSITEANKKRAEMQEENEKLKEASSALETVLHSLEEQTKLLITQLPEPLQDDIKPLSKNLPEKPGETKLTVSERFQNVVGILNHLNKSNLDVTVASELRDLPDGTSAEVTALYIGLGQAYYVGAQNTIAGIGIPSQNGWTWKPVNEAAPQIAQVIAILNNEQVASFVQVPVEIKTLNQ
ncbi:DUF3450 family protein [bacterium]|nr:DUF3450 family protein [bacterium]